MEVGTALRTIEVRKKPPHNDMYFSVQCLSRAYCTLQYVWEHTSCTSFIRCSGTDTSLRPILHAHSRTAPHFVSERISSLRDRAKPSSTMRCHDSGFFLARWPNACSFIFFISDSGRPSGRAFVGAAPETWYLIASIGPPLLCNTSVVPDVVETTLVSTVPSL